MSNLIIKKIIIKKIMLTLCCITLTACGGGSGESKTAPPKVVTPPTTLSFSLGENSLAINEQEEEKVALTFDYTGTGDISYAIAFSPAIDDVSAQVINNELIITTNELENTFSTTLSITVSSSNNDVASIKKTLDLSLINMSVETALAEIKLWKNSEKVFKFDDFDNAVTFYTKSAYFNGGLDNSERAEKIAEFISKKQSSVDKKFSPEISQLAEASEIIKII